MKNSKTVGNVLKRLLALIICAGLLMTLAVPVTAEQTASDNIVDVKTGIADKIINFFVRLVLLIRGSKAIFSSDVVADKYLESLDGSQGRYELDYSFKSDAQVSDIGKMECVTLTKKDSASEKVVIYLAGGAFVREPTTQHWDLIDELCQSTGARFIAAVYPKAPTNTCTVTYEALLELYNGLLQTYSPDNIIIMGDSAGGTIAVSFTQWLVREQLPQPSQLILFSPMLDLALDNEDINELLASDPMLGVEGMHLCVNSWLGDIDIGSSFVNPMACDFSTLPDITMFCGTNEILVFDVELFYNRAVEESSSDIDMYRYDGMYHDFVLYPLSAARDVKSKTVSLIEG